MVFVGPFPDTSATAATSARPKNPPAYSPPITERIPFAFAPAEDTSFLPITAPDKLPANPPTAFA